MTPRPVRTVHRRTDARRNHEVILKIADEAFVGSSADVALDEVARLAGLGRATVYRHFPDRQALAEAVAAYQMDILRDSLTPEGYVSVRLLLRQQFHSMASRMSLVTALRKLPEKEQYEYGYAFVAILEPVLREAQERGELRADFNPEDLLLIFEMLEAGFNAIPPERDYAEASGRLIEVLLDGLCPPL